MALVGVFSYVGKLYLNQVTWHIYHENLHPLFFFFLSFGKLFQSFTS